MSGKVAQWVAGTAAPRAVDIGFTVRVSVVVFRHGDRSPAFNLFDGGLNPQTGDDARGPGGAEESSDKENGASGAQQSGKEELELWASRVATERALCILSKRFPVVSCEGNSFRHVSKLVESSKSSVGASNFKQINSSQTDSDDEQVAAPSPTEQPFGRITWLGLQQLFQRGKQLRQRYEGLCGLKNTFAFSTNFSRTQHSVQSLLHGLAGEAENLDDLLFQHAPPHADEVEALPVFVPPSERDVNNSWDAHQELRDVIGHIQETDPVYRELEETYKYTRQALISNLPFYARSPKRFLWIYACDYFVCRASHGLRLDPCLAPHEHATLDLTTTRFLRWYHNPSVLILAAGDMLRTIFQVMTMQTESSECRFFLYSGHDISVLPLLCAMDVFQVRPSSDKCLDSVQPWLSHDLCWPKYASMLNFELLSSEQVSANGNGRENLFVRVLYNESELIPPTPFDAFWNERVWIHLDFGAKL